MKAKVIEAGIHKIGVFAPKTRVRESLGGAAECTYLGVFTDSSVVTA